MTKKLEDDKILDSLGKSPIDNSLDLNPIGVDEQPVIEMVPADESLPVVNSSDEKTSDELLDKDSTTARDNINSIIVTGQTAVDEMAQVADQSQHPRAYEVLGTLMKQMIDANKDLVKLHRLKKEIKKDEMPQPGIPSTTNQVFVGSTDELLKLMGNDK